MADEWMLVNRSTKRKVVQRRHGNSSNRPYTRSEDEDETGPTEVATRIATCSQHLRRSHFYENALRVWEAYTTTFHSDDQETSALLAKIVVKEIVCYGIGNFASKSSVWYGPLWQLTLALELSSLVNKKFPNNPPCPILYYDPVLTDMERKILQQSYHVNVLTTNEKGKRSTGQPSAECNTVTTTCSTTLFFMPHCPKGLYENVLWANWSQLQQNPCAICIIGNSLATYVERALATSKDNSCQPSCLELIQPFLREHLIAYSKKDVRDMPGQFEAAFNDTYLTWFVMDHIHHKGNGANAVPHDEEETSSRLVWPERPPQPSKDGQTEVL
jgi:SRR1